MSLHPKKSARPKLHSTPATTTTEPKTRSWKQNMWRWVWRSFALLIIIVLLLVVGVYVAQPRYYTLLIIGSDQRNHEHARSDVLMILSIPKSSHDTMSLTTIPRDTKIDHPTKGLQKITHFYAMWEAPDETLGNRPLTQSVVEDLLHIQINGSMEVTFESFDQLVDLLGGVDTTQGHLTGKQAEELVHNRFVQPNGDFGRTAAQREIVENLLSKVKQPANASAVYNYFQHTQRARLTINNLSTGLFAIAFLLGHKAHINFSTTKEIVLPGHGEYIYTPAFNKKLSYWVLDPEATQALVQEYLQ